MNNTKNFEFNKKISINFEWWKISWNSWLLLIHEFCEKIWLQKLLQNYLPENRKGKFEHEKQEIIYQKIIRIISWDNSNNNYEYHKNDSSFLNIHDWKIASPSTCSRLENTFNYSDVEKLRTIQKEIEKINIEYSKTKEVIIDLDTTNDPCSTNLEWSDHIPHYWIDWFWPLFAFNGLNWDMISWILKQWKYHCSTFSFPFVKKIINFYKENWVENISLRWDSAFPKDDILWLCEIKKVHYYLKLKSYSNLKKQIEKKWIRWQSTFFELEYQPDSWSQKRRVIACIDWKARETEESKKTRKKNTKIKKVKQMDLFPIYSFIVTNNQELNLEEVFSMYNWRASIEKNIEEAKNWFKIDHLSNQKFKVNSANFQIYLLAIQIIQLFRKFTLSEKSKTKIEEENKNRKVETKKEWKKFKKIKLWRKIIKIPSIETIRKQLIKIPAKIVETGRKIIYKCSTSFIYQEKFLKVFDTVQNLPNFQNLKIE